MKIKKAILSKFIICLSVVLCGFYIFYTQDNRKEMKMITNYVKEFYNEILNTSESLEKRDVNKMLNICYSKFTGTEREFIPRTVLGSLKIENCTLKKPEKLTDGFYRVFMHLDSEYLEEYEKDGYIYVALINNQWRIIIGVYNIPEEYKRKVEQKGIVLEDPKPNDDTIILDWDDYGVT